MIHEPKRTTWGRFLVLAIIAGLIALCASGIPAQPIAAALSLKQATFTITALAIALSWYVWTGYEWARWVLALLAAAGGVVCLLLVAPRLETLPRPTQLFLFACGLGCLAASYGLLGVRAVKAFLATQRRRRRSPSEPVVLEPGE